MFFWYEALTRIKGSARTKQDDVRIKVSASKIGLMGMFESSWEGIRFVGRYIVDQLEGNFQSNVFSIARCSKVRFLPRGVATRSAEQPNSGFAGAPAQDFDCTIDLLVPIRFFSDLSRDS